MEIVLVFVFLKFEMNIVFYFQFNILFESSNL